MKWGAWLAQLDVQNNNNGDHVSNTDFEGPSSSQIQAVGWWVAADLLPTIGQLPTLGTASYDGHAIGQVLYGNETAFSLISPRATCTWTGISSARRRPRHHEFRRRPG